jgi:hypothetical protein
MGIQDLFTLVFVVIPCLFWCDASSGDLTSPSPETSPFSASISAPPKNSVCFDFSRQIAHFLRPRRMSKSKAQSGRVKENPSGDEYWAMVQGTSPEPISKLYDYLSNRNSTRSSRIDKMDVQVEEDPHFLLKQKVRNEVDPFPLITVSWTEQWAFSLLAGTPLKPQKILISYEKIAGTSHIKHLCGNMMIQAESGKTHITLYEEAEATGRSEADTLNGLQATLKLLQGPNPVRSEPSH